MKYFIEEVGDERVAGNGWEVLIHWAGFSDPTWEKVEDLPDIAEDICEMIGHKVVETRAERARLQGEEEKRRVALGRAQVLVARQKDQLAGAIGKQARDGPPPRAIKAITRPRRH